MLETTVHGIVLLALLLAVCLTIIAIFKIIRILSCSIKKDVYLSRDVFNNRTESKHIKRR